MLLDEHVFLADEVPLLLPSTPLFLVSLALDDQVARVATGIGGALVVDRRVVGKDRGGGEIGHMRMDFAKHSPKCGCGRVGCLEALASGSAIATTLRSLQNGVEVSSAADFQLVGRSDEERLDCLYRSASLRRKWALAVYAKAGFWIGCCSACFCCKLFAMDDGKFLFPLHSFTCYESFTQSLTV